MKKIVRIQTKRVYGEYGTSHSYFTCFLLQLNYSDPTVILRPFVNKSLFI